MLHFLQGDSERLGLSVCRLLVPCVSVCSVCCTTSGPVLFCHVHSFLLSVFRCLTLVFCCDVVELGTYGKLKYYHSMTEEGKLESFHLILCVRVCHPLFGFLFHHRTNVASPPAALLFYFACDIQFCTIPHFLSWTKPLRDFTDTSANHSPCPSFQTSVFFFLPSLFSWPGKICTYILCVTVCDFFYLI